MYMNMCIYTNISCDTFTHIHIYTHVHVCINMWIYTNIHVYMKIYICKNILICMHIYIHLYVCTWIYPCLPTYCIIWIRIYICMLYTSTYMYIYVHTYMSIYIYPPPPLADSSPLLPLCTTTKEIRLKTFGSPDWTVFLFHSFEWRGLPCTSVKTCFKYWGVPWKLVWVLQGTSKDVVSEVLRPWMGTSYIASYVYIYTYI